MLRLPTNTTFRNPRRNTSLASPLYLRKIKASAGATGLVDAVVETGAGIALADGAAAIIAGHETMSAAGIRDLAIINVVEMQTGHVIATGVRETANVAATQTGRVSVITAMPAESAAMMAHAMRNVSGRRNSVISVVAMQPMQTDLAVGMAARRAEDVATMVQETSNVSVRPSNVISVVVMQPMQIDLEAGMAVRREEGVAMMAQETSGRQSRGINAGLTTSVIDGARIAARIVVGTLIVMVAVINAERTAVLMAAVTPIGTVVEINDVQIAALTAGAMHIGMGAEISAGRIAGQTADATPIGTVAAINAGLTDVIKVVVTPIVRAAGTNGDKTGGFIAPIVIVATGMVPAVDTDIGRKVTATLYTIEGMIRSDGCSLTGVGIFIPADLLAIAFRFPKLSVDAGVDLKK